MPKIGRGKIVLSDNTIADLFEGCNFGSSGKTKEGRRGHMVECVLKDVAGYASGSTINSICIEAGLLSPNGNANKAGKRWAFDQIYKSGKTILERLND